MSNSILTESPQWRKHQLQHAIINKENELIGFSKLTSHDWARHLRLIACKEIVAIEALAASQYSVSYIYSAPALSPFPLALSACRADSPAARKAAHLLHELEVELTVWAYLPSGKPERNLALLP